MARSNVDISYFVCSGCDDYDSVFVTICLHCGNVCCPHLMDGLICFRCIGEFGITWPEWVLRFPVPTPSPRRAVSEC